MPTYLQLFEKTQEGRTIDREEAQNRRARGVEQLEELGGEIKALYYGFGPYDAVVIADYPSGEAVGKFQYAYEKMGLTHVESFQVFTADDWDDILEDAPT